MLKVGTHNIKFTAFGFNDDFGSTTVTYDVKSKVILHMGSSSQYSLSLCLDALVLHCKSSVTNSVLTTSCSSNMQISSTTCSVDKEVPRACENTVMHITVSVYVPNSILQAQYHMCGTYQHSRLESTQLPFLPQRLMV